MPLQVSLACLDLVNPQKTQKQILWNLHNNLQYILLPFALADAILAAILETSRLLVSVQSPTSFNAPLSGAGTVNTRVYVAPWERSIVPTREKKSLPCVLAMPHLSLCPTNPRHQSCPTNPPYMSNTTEPSQIVWDTQRSDSQKVRSREKYTEVFTEGVKFWRIDSFRTRTDTTRLSLCRFD